MKEKVPIEKKLALTIEEAAEYSNIGQNKLRELIADPLCSFSLHIGQHKTLIKRRQFEDFIASQIEI